MTKEAYIKLTDPVRKNPKLAKACSIGNLIITAATYAFYPAFLVYLFINKNPYLLKAILTPGIAFVLVSLFRNWINLPRPYEKFDLPPLIKKETKGHSFPSRHVFSIVVIGMTAMKIWLWAGIIILLLGLILSVIRVVTGVHEPKDVFCGYVIGILAGLVNLM